MAPPMVFRMVDGLLQPAPTVSPKQERLMRFVWTYYCEHEQYPLKAEIAAALGSSTPAAYELLVALEKKGVLVRAHGGTRNIRITELGVQYLRKLGVMGAEQLELAAG